MDVYIVQKIDGCYSWGGTAYGDIIKIFSTKEKAEDFCMVNNIDIGSAWPSACIRREEVF